MTTNKNEKVNNEKEEVKQESVKVEDISFKSEPSASETYRNIGLGTAGFVASAAIIAYGAKYVRDMIRDGF